MQSWRISACLVPRKDRRILAMVTAMSSSGPVCIAIGWIGMGGFLPPASLTVSGYLC